LAPLPFAPYGDGGRESDRFLEASRECCPQHYALILVLFTTTMRISTALALRCEDLDRERMEFVAVRRLSERELIPGVKRDRFGEDAPPVMPEVLTALEALWASFNDAQKASGLMFPTLDGQHHDRGVLRKAFKSILKRIGITKRFTVHGCRRTGEKLYGRTAGTRMAMEVAGHRSLAMHNHYTPIDSA
jgi:integrase